MKKFGTYLLLVSGCGLALAPILWGLITSLKQQNKVISYPPQWIPDPFTLGNYAALLDRGPVLQFFLNSIILSIGTIVICVLVAAPAAYAAARFNFRGRSVLLLAILATSMIPGISILIPIYLLATRFDLLNSYTFMILVYCAWMIPQAIWFLKNFIEVIPFELEEAAMLDGCSRFDVMTKIIMPLIQPGIAAVAMLIFMFVWNDFLIGAVLATSEDKRTVQVGLVRFIQDSIGVWWGEFMAFAMLAIAPVLIAFIILQRRFVEGLTSGGIKG